MTDSQDLDFVSELAPTPESLPEFAAMPGLASASLLGEQSAKAATDVGNEALGRSPTASPTGTSV